EKGAPIVTSSGMFLSKGSRILCATALLLTFGGGGIARAQRTLTLEEALSIARRNNRDLAQAKARVEQAHAGVLQAWAPLLPTVAAQGKYTHNYKEVSIDFGTQLFNTLKQIGLIGAMTAPPPPS